MWTMIGVGIALAGLILASNRQLIGHIKRVESRIERVESNLTERIERVESSLNGLRERMAHLEGLLEGLREAITRDHAA